MIMGGMAGTAEIVLNIDGEKHAYKIKFDRLDEVRYIPEEPWTYRENNSRVTLTLTGHVKPDSGHTIEAVLEDAQVKEPLHERLELPAKS